MMTLISVMSDSVARYSEQHSSWDTRQWLDWAGEQLEASFSHSNTCMYKHTNKYTHIHSDNNTKIFSNPQINNCPTFISAKLITLASNCTKQIALKKIAQRRLHKDNCAKKIALRKCTQKITKRKFLIKQVANYAKWIVQSKLLYSSAWQI